MTNPVRSFASDLSRPLGSPWDRAVGWGSTPELAHSFPELAAVIDGEIIIQLFKKF